MFNLNSLLSVFITISYYVQRTWYTFKRCRTSLEFVYIVNIENAIQKIMNLNLKEPSKIPADNTFFQFSLFFLFLLLSFKENKA